MKGIPCPSCKMPIALDLPFIIKNPVSQCPHCKTIMDFKMTDEIVEGYKKVLNEIELIKKQHKGVTINA